MIQHYHDTIINIVLSKLFTWLLSYSFLEHCAKMNSLTPKTKESIYIIHVIWSCIAFGNDILSLGKLCVNITLFFNQLMLRLEYVLLDFKSELTRS